MARPLTNRANYFSAEAERILWSAARSLQSPRFPAESLIAVGWLEAVRYGGDCKYMYRAARRAMLRHIRRQRQLDERQRSFLRSAAAARQTPWPDIAEGLTASQQYTLWERFWGKNYPTALASMLGVTKQAVDQRLQRILAKLKTRRAECTAQ